ncbi:MAG: hypothetical protein WCP69_10690, partial [Bacteroidota bacterium]
MKKREYLFIPIIMSFFLLLFGECGNRFKSHITDNSYSNDTNNVVVFLKDSSLYLYEQKNDTSYFITNLSSGFNTETLESISDSIIIVGYQGVKADSAFLKRTGEPMKCPCSREDSSVLKGYIQFDDYYQFEYNQIIFKAINVYSKKIWIYKTVDFKLARYSKRLGVKTKYYNQIGIVVSVKDTITYCDYWQVPSNPSNDYIFNDSFFSETKMVDNKMIEVSREGSLYISENGNSKILLKNEHPCTRNKCSNGYYFPDLSSDGNWVVFREMASDFEYFDCEIIPKDNGIFEINIKTKELKQLVPHNAMHPFYTNLISKHPIFFVSLQHG